MGLPGSMTDPTVGHASYYPVMLDVSERPCLVVGGGPVAARKARGLLECGASVTVIAPLLSDEMESLSLRLHAVERRPYRVGDVSDYRLVVTATGKPEVDAAVFGDGESGRRVGELCPTIPTTAPSLPAVHRDGAVTVSVSTGGLSPALASWLRDRLAAECGGGLGTLALLLGEGRAELHRTGRAPSRSTGPVCSTGRCPTRAIRRPRPGGQIVRDASRR